MFKQKKTGLKISKRKIFRGVLYILSCIYFFIIGLFVYINFIFFTRNKNFYILKLGFNNIVFFFMFYYH